MEALSIKFILGFALLVGCSGSTSQANRAPATQDRSSAQKVSGKCDFSSYAPVRIHQIDRGAIVKRVQPEYPEAAVAGRIQGQVLVKALVNEKGIVELACAVEGQEVLRTAAEKAALQWKLKPKYGLAFVRPKTEKNPKNFAELYILFEFKLDSAGPKPTPVALIRKSNP